MEIRLTSLAKLANGSRTVSERFSKRFLQSKGKAKGKGKGKQNKGKTNPKGKGKSERENLHSISRPFTTVSHPKEGALEKSKFETEARRSMK